MPLFPESTNDRYEGSLASCRFLAFLAVVTIGPGMIHAFLPDGGAVTIAGLDLGPSAATIIGTFAWAGATQIVHGLAMLAVALRYRTLVPLFLALVLVERTVMSLNWWVLKPGDSGHRPPEVYVTLVLMPLLLWFLARSLASRGGSASAIHSR
jgi:F0F1-type ATP synthase assembly protein I